MIVWRRLTVMTFQSTPMREQNASIIHTTDHKLANPTTRLGTAPPRRVIRADGPGPIWREIHEADQTPTIAPPVIRRA